MSSRHSPLYYGYIYSHICQCPDGRNVGLAAKIGWCFAAKGQCGIVAPARAGDHGMRLLIAMMKHETNTFSPVPTPLARFGNGPGPLYGEAAIRAFRGTGTGLGAYLDLAEREGAEIVLPVAAGASPSGPVDEA